MVQSRPKMVHKWCCGAFPSARGAPRRLGGVHFSSRGDSGRRRAGIPSVRSLVSGRRMVQSGGEMVHFSYSGGIASGGSSWSSRKSLSWRFLRAAWEAPSRLRRLLLRLGSFLFGGRGFLSARGTFLGYPGSFPPGRGDSPPAKLFLVPQGEVVRPAPGPDEARLSQNLEGVARLHGHHYAPRAAARTSRRRTAGVRRALGEPRTGVRAAGPAVRGPGTRVRGPGTAVRALGTRVRAPGTAVPTSPIAVRGAAGGGRSRSDC